MNEPKYYLEKIERNARAIDKVPMDVKEECREHIIWARELVSRLTMLDYEAREKAINKIHDVMDRDYEKMGFELQNNEINNKKL